MCIAMVQYCFIFYMYLPRLTDYVFREIGLAGENAQDSD